MNIVSKGKTKCFWYRQAFLLVMAISVVLSLSSAEAGPMTGDESTQHFKMISSLEYNGRGQFKNRVETLFTLRKQSLLDEKVRYFLSTNDFDLVRNNLNSARQSSSKELSFVIDRNTRAFSPDSRGLALFEKVNNRCVRSLKKVSKENIGQTWKQSFDISFLGSSLPSEMKFTVTAIGLKTKAFGKMIAVRALSEPFTFKTIKKDGEIGAVKSKIGAVYVFDEEIENIYLSISVFQATTKVNGYKEKLRREVATYMTDAAGVSVDFSGLGKKFEKFVRKVGLTGKDLKVVKEAPLPQWAQLDGLRATHVANICAALACEGAFNPVVTVCIPASRVATMQGFGKLASIAELGTVTSSLAKSVAPLGSMKIAAAPAFMGMGLGTTGAIVGGTVGTVAVAGGGGGGGSSGGGGGGTGARSPSTP